MLSSWCSHPKVSIKYMKNRIISDHGSPTFKFVEIQSIIRLLYIDIRTVCLGFTQNVCMYVCMYVLYVFNCRSTFNKFYKTFVSVEPNSSKITIFQWLKILIIDQHYSVSTLSLPFWTSSFSVEHECFREGHSTFLLPDVWSLTGQHLFL